MTYRDILDYIEYHLEKSNDKIETINRWIKNFTPKDKTDEMFVKALKRKQKQMEKILKEFK